MSLAALAKSRLFAHACGRVEGNVLGIEMCKLVLSLVASFHNGYFVCEHRLCVLGALSDAV